MTRDSRALRVLLLSDSYPPAIGGLELAVQSLAHGLASKGHEVTVATLGGPGECEQSVDGDVRIRRLTGFNRLLEFARRDRNHRYHPTVPDPGIGAALRRILREGAPDVVHAHGWIVYSYLLVADPVVPLIVTTHDYGFVCPKKTLVRHGTMCTGPAVLKCMASSRDQYGVVKGAAVAAGLFASSRWHSRVSEFVAISSAMRSVGVLGAPSARVSVIPSPVRETVFEHAAAPPPRPSFLPPGEATIVFIGAAGAHKGVPVLQDAFARLRRPARLVLITTSGRERRQGEDPPTAIVRRDQPHEVVLATLAHATVAAVPSVWPEPFGLVAAEAMAFGVPVVASRIGGLVDIVAHEENGLLVPPGDAVALAEALDRVLADPALRARLGARSRETAERFRESRIVARTEEVYRAALERSSSGRRG